MKLETTFATPTTQDGTVINLAPQVQGDANPLAFAPIAPGYYPAILHKMTTKTYKANFKGYPNPNDPNGLWDYVAVTPSVELLNGANNVDHETGEEVNSWVTRQDVVVGVFFNGKPLRPDGTNDSPFWRDAQNLFSAVSLFTSNGAQSSINGDTDWIVDRPVIVRTGVAGYVSGINENYTPQKLTQLLGELQGDVNIVFDDYERLVADYNYEKGYTTQDGEQIQFVETDKHGNTLENPIAVRLRLKNYIVGWYLPNKKQVADNGWFVHNGMVFKSEAHAISYDRIVNASQNARSDDF